MTGANEFAAAGSMAGYLYQCRYALLLMLRRLELSPDLCLGLETVDDIEIEDAASERYQVKHHQSAGGLGDMSVDWWKTIRVWLTEWDSNAPPQNLLVTTAVCAAGSAGAHLRYDTHEPDVAHDLLVLAAQTSSNDDTAETRREFLDLGEPDRRLFVDSIMVLDGEPAIDDIEQHLETALVKVAGRKAALTVREHLEGWWIGRCIACLVGAAESITMAELERKVDELRLQVADDALPLTTEIFDASGPAEDYNDRMFIRQLELIGIGERRLLFAIRDYWRAYTQRSKWVEDGLLYPGELDTYERRLREAWESRFEMMRDLLGDSAVEETIRAEAQKLYGWAENDAAIYIRSKVTEPSLVSGSFHILSEDLRVGWHPEFAALLMKALEPAVAE